MIELAQFNSAPSVVKFLEAASHIASDVDFKVGRRAELTIINRIHKTDFMFSEEAEKDLIALFDLPMAVRKDGALGLEVQDERGIVRATRSLENGYRARITKHPATNPARVCYAIRFLEKTPRDLDRCGVPRKFYDKVKGAERGGFACVTGKTGSGKSTSLMAIVNEWIRDRPGKAVVIEAPLEYELDDSAEGVIGSIVQIEIGTDLQRWEEAMELLMWVRPRLIVIGEVTSPAVMEKILALSDAGHIVLFTLHTNGPIETVSRILSFFSAEAHARVRAVVGKNLIATMGQRLVPALDNATEVMIPDVWYNNPAATATIQNPEANLSDLYASADVQADHLMLDVSILEKVKEKQISFETAFGTSENPKELFRAMEREQISVPPEFRRVYTAKAE